MKKITFIITMLLFSITSYSQIDTTTVVETETITTAERVIDKYSGKAYEAVKELATALKVPAEHVYTILVKQAVVNAITDLIILVFSLICVIVGIKWAINKEYWDEYTGPKEAKPVVGMILGFVSTVVFLTYLTDINSIVGGFINPEYYAIKQILEVLS